MSRSYADRDGYCVLWKSFDLHVPTIESEVVAALPVEGEVQSAALAEAGNVS